MTEWMTVVKLSNKLSYDDIKANFSKYIGRTGLIICSYSGMDYPDSEGNCLLLMDDGMKVYWLHDEIRPATEKEIREAGMKIVAGKI